MAQAVRSKEQQLERLRSSPASSFSAARENELIPEPPKDKRFRFRFPPSPRCGSTVFEVAGVSHGYPKAQPVATEDTSNPNTNLNVLSNIDSINSMNSKSKNMNWILRDVNLQVEKGERIGIVGKNGVGKSTLLRLLAGIEDPLKGAVDIASATVQMGYFSQNQADQLDLDMTIVETIQQAVMDGGTSNSNNDGFMSITDIRTLLGQFMFKGDAANKQLHMLSGGEKARVALCRLLVSPCNVLLLDEPTNHLDIVSKVVLEDALVNFDGTLVVVSHDRHFMSKVVNKIYEFDENTGNINVHNCDYHEYLTKKCATELQEKVAGRYVDVEGKKIKIESARPVEFAEHQQQQRTRHFGGSGVTSGNTLKGIKNAKRMN
jgi:ATPase subunit of ABC transporter with duplicated ATPase domains